MSIQTQHRKMGPAGKDSGGSVVGIAGAKIDSLEALSKYFVMPEKHVAKELGICLTSLKKLCRHYGITRWPYRKVMLSTRALCSQPPVYAGHRAHSPRHCRMARRGPRALTWDMGPWTSGCPFWREQGGILQALPAVH